MRVLIASLLLATATPAAAQVTTFELDRQRMEMEAAQRRAIDLGNQLQAQDARRRADDAATAAAIQRGPMRAPELRYEPSTTPSGATAVQSYPSVPDAILSDSNRRVRDAANNRR